YSALTYSQQENDLRIRTADGGTLTVGPDVTVRNASGSTFTTLGNGNADTIVLGTVQSDSSGGTLRVTGKTVSNQGSMRADGGTLDLNNVTGDLGDAKVSGGGTLDVAGTFTNNLGQTIDGSNLTFRGTWSGAAPITATGVSTVDLGGTWTNTSAIAVDSGSLLRLSGSWSNGGTISANASTVDLLSHGETLGSISIVDSRINLQSGYTTSELESISSGDTSAYVQPGGTLDNAGDDFVLAADGYKLYLDGGKISGGTISSSDDTKLIATSNDGTLDGVTLNADGLVQQSAIVSVTGGLNVNGLLRLERTTNNASDFYDTGLDFYGEGAELGGSGVVELYSVLTYSQQENDLRIRSVDQYPLTIGENVTVQNAPGSTYTTLGYSQTPLSIRGTIVAQSTGQTLRLTGSEVINAGTLISRPGATLSARVLSQTAPGTTEVGINGDRSSEFGRISVDGVAELDGAIRVDMSADADLTDGTEPPAVSDYQFDGDLSDSLGGPSLVSNGGTVQSGQYVFSANQGLKVENAIANPSEYSIELTFTWNSTSNWKRLISFANLADDTGLYSINGQLYFWPNAAGAAGAIQAGQEVTVLLTRDESTREVVGYVNGIWQFSFIDSSNRAVFSAANNVAWFFQDNGSEEGSGSVNRIRIFDRVIKSQSIMGFFSSGSVVGAYADESGLNLGSGLQLQLQSAGGGELEFAAVAPTNDTTAPQIQEIVPPDGGVGPRVQDLEVRFDERMDVTTLTPGNFAINGPTGAVSPEVFRVTDLGSAVTLDFRSLEPGSYTLTLAADQLTDRSGNALGAGDITSTFTIEAQTATWIAAGSGNWDDAANWQDGRVPQPGDDVVINVPANATITHRSGSTQINSLTTAGRLNLTGGRLDVIDTLQADGGITIDGGTLAGATVIGTGEISVSSNTSNRLDGVTLETNIALTDYRDFLRIDNGLELNATMTVGRQARVYFRGSQSLSGTGEVLVSQSHTDASYAQGLFLEQSFTTLVIEDGITVRGGNGAIGRSGYWGSANNVSVINRGIIAADTSGRTIEIRPDGGSFTNEGVIRADGGTLDVDGLAGNGGTLEPISGTLDLSGNYVLDQNVSGTGVTVNLRGTWDNQATIDLTSSSLTVTGNWTNNGTITTTGGSVFLNDN
ncbi:hypothetical protein FYK55_28555, partial [Roseiconus nitratireducens]